MTSFLESFLGVLATSSLDSFRHLEEYRQGEELDMQAGILEQGMRTKVYPFR